jgi:DNA-binding MarR family transcriptional regulator
MPIVADDQFTTLDFDVLASSVGAQVNLTRRALWIKARQARSAQPVLRTPSGYYSALIVIGANPGVSQRKLADELYLDAGALGDIVDLLEKNGLVERRRDPADRRRFNLFVTAAGKNMFEHQRKESAAHDRSVTACLTSEEVQQLLHMLKRLRA